MSQPAVQSVSTPIATKAACTFGLLLAILGVLMTADIRGLSAGMVDRFLEQDPQLVFVAAVVLLAPVVLGLGDFLRVRKRSYRPPSIRVQLDWYGLHGALLSAAQCLVLFGLYPRPLAQFVALGWVALSSVASEALRFTNDFLIGRRGGEHAQGGPGLGDQLQAGHVHQHLLPRQHRRWEDAHRRQAAPGAGLFNWPGDGEVDCRTPEGRTVKVSERRMRKAPFILDTDKGNMAQDLIIPRARVAGRLDDVLIISPDAVQTVRRELAEDEIAFQKRLVSFNLLANGSPQALAVRLVSALTVMSNQEPNSYYRKMQTEFASNAFAILHETLGAGRYTLLDLWRFVCEEDFQKALLEQASPGDSIAYRWFFQQWAKEDPRERMMRTKGCRADLTQFVSEEMRPTFCQAEATFPGWKCLTEEGKIVIFNMNSNGWGTLAWALGVFLTTDFQDFMLARSTPAFKLAGGDNDRLAMRLADEAWLYMNENWANFTTASREARRCTIALYQGLAQIPEEYRPTMPGNHSTWVMLAVNDSITTQTLSAELDTYQTVRVSRSEASGYRAWSAGSWWTT